MVSRIFVHQQFVASNLRNDIAVLRLANVVPLGQTPTIGTICLPSTQAFNTRCWVAGNFKSFLCNKKQDFSIIAVGWGRNGFSNSSAYQAVMKEVDVPLIDQSSCQNQLKATRLGLNFVLDSTSFMCAGGEEGKGEVTETYAVRF